MKEDEPMKRAESQWRHSSGSTRSLPSAQVKPTIAGL
jgi:hypothetical protein